MVMPESAVGVAGYSYVSISLCRVLVVSDLISVFPERSEATEVGDVPAVALDIHQLPYVEVHLLSASLSDAACNGSVPE